MSKKPRDYEKEYRDYHGKPAQIKDRATRTGLRILEGKLAKYGVEVAGVVAGGTLRAPVAGITRIPNCWSCNCPQPEARHNGV